MIPRRIIPGLDEAPATALDAPISVSPAGDALSWPSLDVDVYIPGLVERTVWRAPVRPRQPAGEVVEGRPEAQDGRREGEWRKGRSSTQALLRVASPTACSLRPADDAPPESRDDCGLTAILKENGIPVR